MRIPISAKHLRLLGQLILFIFVIVIAWKVLHRQPAIPKDAYPYLTSLAPAVVKQCLEEYRTDPALAWAELLAVRSTLAEHEAQPLIDQIKNKVTFSNMNWQGFSRDQRKKIERQKDILTRCEYYQPGKYQFPVRGETWFEDSFGSDREGGKRKHEGTDLFSSEGTPIVSVCAGKVEQLGWNRLGGERVGIRGDDGNYYYYAHLQTISPERVKGERVAAGEYLGDMGHTGDALTTPDHLHFGIELPDGQWINPYSFLAAWQIWEDEISNAVGFKY